MCYILGVVALLAACDVTNNSHYLGRYLATSRPRAFLGFYQELEIGLIRQEMVIFFVLDMKNKTHKQALCMILATRLTLIVEKFDKTCTFT